MLRRVRLDEVDLLPGRPMPDRGRRRDASQQPERRGMTALSSGYEENAPENRSSHYYGIMPLPPLLNYP